MSDPLDRFAPATRAWFAAAFPGPTTAQAGAWSAIEAGDHALVVAPTGSGKTLAAFLWSLDHLMRNPEPDPARRCRVLYVSPLKALAADVERNLRAPLVGIRQAAGRLGEALPEVTVGVRTGDTPATERRTFASRPPDVLITTPESLYLILTSGARAGLAGVRTVIVDEIHAVAGTKRGAHLALSLERLDALLEQPGYAGVPAQRIGLSATVRPVATVARFLGGDRPPAAGGRAVRVVQPPADKQVTVDVVVPVPDLTELDATAGTGENPARARSVWPHVEERVVDLVTAHRSTLVFTNSRRGAERLTARVNEVWGERNGHPTDPGALQPAQVTAQSGASAGLAADLARAHHGSMSRAERTHTETELKAGRLPAVVATSSLELGIDMGTVDLVVQVGAPPSVASGLQRIGRAGHQVGVPSHGVMLPTFRGELIPAAVVAERMRQGQIEELHLPANPLDVLAQQIVAMVAMDDWAVVDLAATVRRAAQFANLGEATLHAVLDMLAGRYPSEDFADLRPRIVWDRARHTLTARPGARQLAVISGGTIPDRGLYGVFLAGETRGGKRVGELDEEMVYESRAGDTFTLGSTTWRIEDITPDQVVVTPAPGLPGRLPFWKGDAPGRPAELGRAIGQWVRELVALPEPQSRARLQEQGLSEWAADNLLAYLTEQRAATGQVPDDRTIVVERFRDEIGDWRIVVHSPLGARIHAPWALLIAARLRERHGDTAALHSDDGIVLRLPDMGEDGEGPRVDLDDLLLDPDEVPDAVRAALGGSALFAARFREAAARALLLPRRRPDRRQPLWQQRQRSAQLLAVAAEFPDFPILLEAARECLQDDFDVAALSELMRAIRARQVRLVEVTSAAPSPFARSLLFGYTAQFLYEGDAPLAERRTAALALDPTLLAELLGQQGASQLADLLDPAAVARTEAEVAGTAPERQAGTVEELADVLRRHGPLPETGLLVRVGGEVRAEVPAWLAELEAARRAIRVRLQGVEQWAAVEDAARLRDGLGVPLPVGVPAPFTEPVSDPLGDLVRRHARTTGPFTAAEVADRFGLGIAVVQDVLRRLEGAGILVAGRIRPEALGGRGDDFCDAGVLRLIRRRSLAALRAEVEPVAQRTLGVFLPRWQGVGALQGVDGVLRVVEQLAGAAVPASALESLVLPARVQDYRPAMLDELMASGEVLWAGHGSLAARDGLVSLHIAGTADLTLPDAEPPPEDGLHRMVWERLSGGGAFFLPALVGESETGAVLTALWDLVWLGQVTNDSFAVLRNRLGARPGGTTHPQRPTTPRARPVGRLPLRPTLPPRPEAIGRWSLLPAREADPTVRARALAAQLLDRYGVVTRGVGEGVPFGTVYRVLGAMEEAGQVRRGYFVEHLGGSQFALPGAVDQLRTQAAAEDALVLAATDPANPYGAALAWPEVEGHRPGRKAGGVVVLVGGELALYVERGGRTLLSFSTDPEVLTAGAEALAAAARGGRLGRLTFTRADGAAVLDRETLGAPVATALAAAGFGITPRGLRLRPDARG